MSRKCAAQDESIDDLLTKLGSEIRALSESFFKGEPRDHTLQPTALIHEVWIRLVQSEQFRFQSKGAFLAYVATAMRNILVDHARHRRAERRGRDWVRCELNLDGLVVFDASSDAVSRGYSLVELDEELKILESTDPVSAQAFVLRFLGGMTHDQIGDRLGLSGRRIQDYVEAARLWLRTRLNGRARVQLR
ncbi:MAG: sigma-70 family RNA polymerase sigma factor [Phycisphaeraceae bacterium]|nr:sigma-70 family RNA polymerase sigma factor [Phycisphaeraceae bacterium]